MNSKSLRHACAALAVLGCVAAAGVPAAAQTVTGTIQGTVVDTSGGVLPGVTVSIVQTATGAERTVVTNEVGFYGAPYLPIGPYRLTATLSGFGTILREGITLGLNDTRVVDFAMSPAAVAETVTVRGEAPPINKTSAEIKGSLTAEQIMDKPTLSAGSFLTLAEVFTGFQENPTSGQNNPTASSGSSINFNNTGTRGATFQINGVNNDDSSENQNRQGAALSTIQEFQVLKNGYSAEFGRGDGAVVLVQTKSGTNQVNGDVYEYYQNNQWNARSYFAAPGSPKAERKRSQYGFTLGLPIVSNKLFAFGNVDRTKNDGQNNITRDLFLPSEINGPWLTRGNDTPQNRAWIQGIIDRFPSSLSPNDPRSPRTWYGEQTINYPDEDYSGRLDWNANQQNTLVGRYQYTHQLRETEDVIIGENAKQDNEQQNLGITWTRVFGSRMVGEARYGLGVRSTNVDIAAGNDTPIVRFTGTPVAGSIIGNAGNFPIHRDQTDQQFVYNLTWQWAASHSLRTGTDIRRQQLDDLADNYSRGYWTFSSTTACGGVTYATPYLAMLDGCAYRFQKDYGPFFLENRMHEWNMYAQDDWRIRENLTVNLGLRYEYVSAPTETQNRVDYVYGADADNVEPRLGFAYVPKWGSGWLGKLSGGSGNLSFRGGWGIYDGRIFQSIFSQGGANVRFNPPNALDRVWTNTLPNALNVSDPSLGFVFTPGPQTARVSLTLPDEDLEMPASRKWNVSVERVLPFDSSLRITYTHNYNGKRLKYTYDNLPLSPLDGPVTVVDHPYNAPTGTYPDLRGKQITAIAANVTCAGTGFYGLAVTTACPTPVPIADNEISYRVPRTNERRPDPLYTTNLLIRNDAEAWYDGIEFEWVKRMSHGLQFQAAYTFSKSMDTTSEATYVGTGDSNQQGPNSQYAKGYSRFHTPHRFTLNGSYRLPFFDARTDWVGQAFGGWHLSGVLKLASGTPFSITSTALDLDFDGYAEARPVVLDRSVLGARVDDPATSQQRLPVSAFRNQQWGDSIDDLVPRNAFYADGLKTVDLALSKIFRMPWQGQSLAVRVEAFNALNWVQFGFPNVDINNVSFGRILGAQSSYSPRTLQFVVRYRY
jgi:hypothetical protein